LSVGSGPRQKYRFVFIYHLRTRVKLASITKKKLAIAHSIDHHLHIISNFHLLF